jgi:tetratricopeptide (TPR) repeat protein
MPCHKKLVNDAAGHGHHQAGSKGNECVACHMPMTRFAAMGRTDHSMRPPAPAATLAFKSPNACNLCHADRDASWADGWVRQWYPRDYQAEVLRRAALVDQARKRDWKHLGEMLAALRKQDGDEVYKTSLVRLLAGCEDSGKWPALLGLLEDASPLVRSSAVSALGGHLTPEVLKALLAATADPSRLVRIRSAMALAAVDPASLSGQRERTNLQQAIDDFMAAMHARPDDWSSHANLGNFYFESHDFTAAAACFETATRLEPRQIGPLVNAAMAYSNLDQNDKAEASLRRALALAPQDAAANFNLGLLLGESQRWDEAEQRLRSALASNPQMAAAAYNLGVILARRSPDEAIAWCRNAHQLRPEEAKYAHTLAFYLRQKGNFDEAVVLLRQVIREEPLYWDAYGLLGEIYEDQRDYPKAAAVYNDALKMEPLPPPLRRQLETKVRAIESRRRPGEGR